MISGSKTILFFSFPRNIQVEAHRSVFEVYKYIIVCCLFLTSHRYLSLNISNKINEEGKHHKMCWIYAIEQELRSLLD